ncbi:MAG: hypothetical protein K5855_00810 [Oscillospiraceae bacterium]|jgi:hypothetical protein|nr:hypothetical protein [Oscillospiraceae bacterium]
MSGDYRRLAGSLMGDGGSALEQNAETIQKLADSPDGRRVKALIGDEGRLASAVENGDTEALKSMMRSVLGTAEGARLAKQLTQLLDRGAGGK